MSDKDHLAGGSESSVSGSGVPEHLARRYERVRQQCLRYANLHDNDKSVCHQALTTARYRDPLAVEFAVLVDDLMLALAERPADPLAEITAHLKKIASNTEPPRRGMCGPM